MSNEEANAMAIVVLEIYQNDQIGSLSAVAKFIVTEWGIKLTPALGCRTGLPAYVEPLRQPYAGDNFITPVKNSEFGF